MNRVVLVGYAATGKSTVGRLLAEELGRYFVDTDTLAERRFGGTVAEIFARCGEQGFRKLEAEVLREAALQDNCVVSVGGGSVLLPQFELLAAGSRVVWLTASAHTVFARLSGTRPLSDGKTEQQLAEHMASRAPLYAKFAQLCVCTDGLSPRDAAKLVLRKLES